MNGVYQVIGEIIQPMKDKTVSLLQLNRESFSHKLLQMMLTFLLIDFSWIFFRANSFKESILIIKSIFQIRNPWIFFDGSLYGCGLDNKNFGLMLFCVAILIIADYCKYKGFKLRKFIINQDYWFRWLFVVLTICFILVFGVWGTNYDANSFIYFQF